MKVLFALCFVAAFGDISDIFSDDDISPPSATPPPSAKINPDPVRRVEAATPAPTPAPTPSTPTESEDERSHRMHSEAQQALMLSMATSGTTYEQGAWLYGDWKSIAGMTGGPGACAAACAAESNDCTHWNYHVLRHDCELRRNSADNPGYLERLNTYVTGLGPANPRRTSAEVDAAENRRLGLDASSVDATGPGEKATGTAREL